MKPGKAASAGEAEDLGLPIPVLQELHLLTRDGALNQDARRKLKQIRHFGQLLGPGLQAALAAEAALRVCDMGAGKSYLGFFFITCT